jgi:hypothetical protein
MVKSVHWILFGLNAFEKRLSTGMFISIHPMMVLYLQGAFKTTSTITTRKYTTIQKKLLTTGTMNHSKNLPYEKQI